MNPLLRELRIFYCRWALSEMHPLHPDVPKLTLYLRDLIDLRAPVAHT